MPKVPLSTISSGYGTVDALNANFDAIEAAFDNTLSRDGSTPNHMVANFDMNGKNILNAGTVYTGGINIGGVDLEPGDSVASATVQVFEYVATAGQTTFSVAPLSPTTSALLVEVNGLAIPSSLVVVSGSLVSIPAREVNDAVILRVFTKLIGAPETTLASEISFAYNQAYPAGSVGFGLKGGYGINITQAPFYADSTGVQDVGPAIEAAHVAFPGVPLYAPAGTYRLSTKPNIKTSVYDGVFGAGVKLFGDGALKTYFINDISNDAAIDIDSDVNHATTFKAAFGVTLQGFTLKRTSTTTNGTGIRLRTSYNVSIKDVYVLGMSGDGINIPCSVGDNDGSNMVFLEHVRIENCAGWGFNAAADSGFNETSYINMQHVFIQGCGTTNANFTPPSGGMAWIADFPDPSNFWGPILGCGGAVPGGWNWSQYCNKTLYAEAVKADAMTDPAKADERQKLWGSVFTKAMDEAPWVPIFNEKRITMKSSRLGGDNSLFIDPVHIPVNYDHIFIK